RRGRRAGRRARDPHRRDRPLRLGRWHAPARPGAHQRHPRRRARRRRPAVVPPLPPRPRPRRLPDHARRRGACAALHGHLRHHPGRRRAADRPSRPARRQHGLQGADDRHDPLPPCLRARRALLGRRRPRDEGRRRGRRRGGRDGYGAARAHVPRPEGHADRAPARRNGGPPALPRVRRGPRPRGGRRDARRDALPARRPWPRLGRRLQPLLPGTRPAHLPGRRRPQGHPRYAAEGDLHGPAGDVRLVRAIEVRDLRKIYQVHERQAGVAASLRSLVRRTTRPVAAVDGISFDVDAGEVVGFLGPNGAGKTTTLKMLSGLLHPSSGEARVLGFEPARRERDFLRQITLVMGQRNQLVWDIPAADSYELNRAIYRIPAEQFRATLDELVELLELGPLIRKQVRSLSLGERMKCEIAAALLHQPKVLFLDEPTIGLDVTAQRRIRAFVAEYNRRHGATVLLTSHYMADVEALCRRVIVIHHGRLRFDGGVGDLVARFSPHKTIVVELGAESVDLGGLPVVERDGDRVTLRVPKAETARVTERVLATLPVVDLTVEDPPIEEVIEQVFASGPDHEPAVVPGR